MTRAPSRSAKKNSETAGSSLAARIVTAPLASQPKEARAKVAAWLSEVGRTAAGKALKDAIAGAGGLRALIEGLADGSPYLWELASQDPARLLGVLRADPDARLQALIAETAAAMATTDDEAEAMRLLRHMKQEGALLIALADIGGVWPMMRVTEALTQLADAAISFAIRFLIRGAAAQGKLQGVDPAEPEKDCGLIVLAMGKMGAFELNYSSDIDLIVLFDPTRSHAGAGGRAGTALPASHPRPGEAPAGAHRRRLRLPRRPAAAARSGLDPDRGVARFRARLLRERGPELGARRHDQGAAVRRRHGARARISSPDRRRSSGASISTSPRSPTSTR